MTISVVTVAYGDTYRGFLPDWAEAVRELSTQPDEVIVTTDDVDAARAALGNLPATVIPVEGTHVHHPQVYVNGAIQAATGDYICKMDVDDLFYPWAFDGVDTLDADVIMFGITVSDLALPSRGVTAWHILNTVENLVFSGSMFRRWVWEAAPFRDMVYEDWAFWWQAAKNGATFLPTGRVDYHYRQHGDNISRHADDAYWRSVVRSLA